MSIRRGEIMSVIGPNGAGKTSLLNMISGFYRPTNGTITLEGRDITHARPSEIAALGVARTFQNIALFKGMTVLDNIMLGRHVHMRAGVLSSFIYWGLAQKEELAHRARVEELIDFLELQNIRKQPSAALPYGLRKRVELGRALVLEPKMLLLDEPMGGMNQGEKEDMARFILEVNAQWGTTIILIEHDMAVVMDISDRVTVRQQDRRGHADGRAAQSRRDSGLSRHRRPAGGRMKAATTLLRLLHRNAAGFATGPALREKRGGIWQVLNWSDYELLASRFAGGLGAHGFGRGDKLAVIGDNRPRLYAAMLAAQSLGGAAVPLWPDAEPDWIAQVVNHACVTIVVAEDAEQVGKIGEVKDRMPGLRLVVQTTSHGMRQPEHGWLTSFEKVADAGTGVTERSEPGEPALLLYSNNPGDEVRGAILSHADLLAAAEALMATEDVRQTDETLAWLPMAWFGDALTSQALALSVGFTCNCPENPETARRDLREIGPTILIAPPEIWEEYTGRH